MRFPQAMLGLAAGLFLCAATARSQSLDARLNSLLASPSVRGASISLDVVELTPTGPVGLCSHDAQLPLAPASNCKLLTTAAAFERYGPAATFKTYLYQAGEDLVIVGGGDPGLGDAKICAAQGVAPTGAFEAWAALAKQKGIVQYHDLIVDDRIFDSQWVHPDWPADQRLDWYSAPIGGLNFNANCLDWTPRLTARGIEVELLPQTSYVSITIKATKGKQTRVSLVRPAESNHFELRGTLAASASSPYSVPIYDPGLWTGTILRDVLARSGINGRRVRRVEAGEHFSAAILLATHETPMLSVIQRANTNSLNMMAECLCKRLGYDATKTASDGAAKPGTWDTGTAAITAYVTSLGAKSDWISLDDGSGLSKKNRVAAKAFTTVLAHVATCPQGEKFVQTLALPGEDGTLERRFKSMAVGEHIHAKTGHITGASTLSGYIDVVPKDAPPRRFAFSILVNKYQGNVNPWQDQVCQAIYQWAGGT